MVGHTRILWQEWNVPQYEFVIFPVASQRHSVPRLHGSAQPTPPDKKHLGKCKSSCSESLMHAMCLTDQWLNPTRRGGSAGSRNTIPVGARSYHEKRPSQRTPPRRTELTGLQVEWQGFHTWLWFHLILPSCSISFGFLAGSGSKKLVNFGSERPHETEWTRHANPLWIWSLKRQTSKTTQIMACQGLEKRNKDWDRKDHLHSKLIQNSDTWAKTAAMAGQIRVVSSKSQAAVVICCPACWSLTIMILEPCIWPKKRCFLKRCETAVVSRDQLVVNMCRSPELGLPFPRMVPNITTCWNIVRLHVIFARGHARSACTPVHVYVRACARPSHVYESWLLVIMQSPVCKLAMHIVHIVRTILAIHPNHINNRTVCILCVLHTTHTTNIFRIIYIIHITHTFHNKTW